MSEPYEMRFHRAQNTVTLLREELMQTKLILRKVTDEARRATTPGADRVVATVELLDAIFMAERLLGKDSE